MGVLRSTRREQSLDETQYFDIRTSNIYKLKSNFLLFLTGFSSEGYFKVLTTPRKKIDREFSLAISLGSFILHTQKLQKSRGKLYVKQLNVESIFMTENI